ncbi:DUF6489 family protein [Parvularcula sp. IMCC14364]|uniref:DUF6489 family protein n=1 Tax=Parvularcula sp. IMCC14364 TaxID=3067902 RepID=UPI00274079E8|nr:DUF6489 family protein [Parvularcula sp. IMCC14364]
MKLTINVDCTPEEARTFFGLPNVKPVNELLVNSLEERVREEIDTLSDPQKYFDRLMQMGGTGVDNMQKMFSGLMAAATKPDGK